MYSGTAELPGKQAVGKTMSKSPKLRAACSFIEERGESGEAAVNKKSIGVRWGFEIQWLLIGWLLLGRVESLPRR